MVLPAFAVIAELDTPDAYCTTTVPLADGVMTPSIVAVVPEVLGELALHVVGCKILSTLLIVSEDAVSPYRDT
jgi:hypothetical protein